MCSEYNTFMQTPIGQLKLKFQDEKLCSLSVVEEYSVEKKIEKHKCSEQAENNVFPKLQKYFSSAITFKKIPLVAEGTPFQQKVWHELLKIPLGETRTYGEIAKKINSSPRAVGNACRKNPIQIIIPCHRVVSAKGIGGYAGETEGKQLNIKRWLLAHEGVVL